MILESEKTDFCKSAYFVGPADAGRLSRSQKIIKNHQKNIKFHNENEHAKKNCLLRPTFGVFDLILGSAGDPGGSQKCEKECSRGCQKKARKKKVAPHRAGTGRVQKKTIHLSIHLISATRALLRSP